MNTWQTLKSTALLGTDKMPFEAKILPVSLQKVLEKTPKNDPEGYFLKAAALSFTYQKAGQSPARITLPEVGKTDNETQSFCPPKAIEVWRNVLDNEHFNPHLFEYLVEICMQKNWIVPQNLLTNVLTQSPKKQLPKVHQVIGKRGQWLVQFNPDWQIQSVEEDKNKLWEEGKPVERKQFFAQKRTDNPAEALELFKKSWSEESAKDRKDLLGILAISLSKADEDFLNEKHDELANGKMADKPIILETTQLINQLRLKIDGSTFGKEVFEKITTCLEKKKGLLASVGLGAGSWLLNLPKKEDDFWNGNAMNKTFGFDKLTTLKGFTDADYWFGELLRHLNPAYWLRFFEQDIQKMITFFTEAEGVKKKDNLLFINQLSQAMILATPAQIETFLSRAYPYSSSIQWIPLFQQLSDTQAETLLIKHYALDANGLREFLQISTEECSPTFSEYILKILAKELHQNSYYLLTDKNFINLLGKRLSGNVAQLIANYSSQIGNEWQRNYWDGAFTDNLLRQIDKKNEITKLRISL